MFVLDWLQVRDTDHKGKLENVKMIQPTLNTSAVTKMKHFLNHTINYSVFWREFGPHASSLTIATEDQISSNLHQFFEFFAEWGY